MGIKVTKSKNNDKSFPKLMKGSSFGTVALFTSKTRAIILEAGDGSSSKMGDEVYNPPFQTWTDYTGSITLENL